RPPGLGILNIQSASEIDVRACIKAGMNLATDPDAALELPLLHFVWNDTYTATFNLGVSAFNLIGAQTTGKLDITAGFDLYIGFLLSKKDGLMLKLNGSSPTCKTPGGPLKLDADPEINLSLEVKLAQGSTIEAN